MRGSNRIAHHPYIPLNRPLEHTLPYICRLAPFHSGFELEWLRRQPGAHKLYYRQRNTCQWVNIVIAEPTLTVDGLESEREYEVYIEDPQGFRSNIRLLRTGQVPDGAVVINYLHPEDTQYAFSGNFLCSPSLTRLPDGALLASMDLYGHRMAQNLMLLFRSDDDGKTWKYWNDLYPFYWGSLFCHRGRLYVLGLTTEYGNLQIAASDDGGITWTTPTVLLYGSNVLCGNGGMHRAPMDVVHTGGRIYTTCEYGSWSGGSHLPAVISIDENDDLLCCENWYCTSFLPYDGQWKKDSGEQGNTMEGNIVSAPDGCLYNLLRYKAGEMLRLRIDRANPEAPLEYAGILPLPAASSMFRILHMGSGYLLVTNIKDADGNGYVCDDTRCNLALFRSTDLEHWEFLRYVVHPEHADPAFVGFQYPAPILEGQHLSLAVRSAFNAADSFHNSNYILFWQFSGIG